MPWLNYNKKEIFYRAEGNGSPVMFLHGFGEDGSVWDGQLEYFKSFYRVIIPDLPGSGQSALLDSPCYMKDYAKVIKAIADTEISRKKEQPYTFSLIGHSMGGYISMAFASKYGYLLNSLGLFHSSAMADDAAKITSRKKSIQILENKGAEHFLKATVSKLFSEETRKSNPEMLTKLIEAGARSGASSLIQYTRAMIARDDNTGVLKSFPNPVLFIIGVQDQAVPLNNSLKQCHLPLKNSVHFLQKSGHMGMWEEMALSNTYIMNFLKGLVYTHS